MNSNGLEDTQNAGATVYPSAMIRMSKTLRQTHAGPLGATQHSADGRGHSHCVSCGFGIDAGKVKAVGGEANLTSQSTFETHGSVSFKYTCPCQSGVCQIRRDASATCNAPRLVNGLSDPQSTSLAIDLI